MRSAKAYPWRDLCGDGSWICRRAGGIGADGVDISKAAGADFVKTSTGFGPSGATVHDVELMRRLVGPATGVKASGGIRTLDDLNKMVAAGATRIGASAGVKIVEAARAAALSLGQAATEPRT